MPGRKPYLTGERLFLAPPEVGDAPALAEWLNDPEVWRPFGTDWPTSAEAERKWVIDHAERRDELNLLIFEKGADNPLGLVGLRNIDGVNGTARLGVLIGAAGARGRGYGEGAVRLMLAHGFDDLGLRRINLSVLADNGAAIALYEKLGFVKEGCERRAQLRAGRHVDRLHFGLFAEEFRRQA